MYTNFLKTYYRKSNEIIWKKKSIFIRMLWIKYILYYRPSLKWRKNNDILFNSFESKIWQSLNETDFRWYRSNVLRFTRGRATGKIYSLFVLTHWQILSSSSFGRSDCWSVGLLVGRSIKIFLKIGKLHLGVKQLNS